MSRNDDAARLLQGTYYLNIEKRLKRGSFFEMEKNVNQDPDKVYYKQFLEFCCKHSTLETLQWLFDNKFIYSNSTTIDDLVNFSIKNGRLDIMKMLMLDPNYKLSDKRAKHILTTTRCSAQREMYEWLYTTFPICQTVQLGDFELTCKEKVPFFKWLYENNYLPIITDKNVYDPIIFFEEQDAIEFLTWLIFNAQPQYEFPENALKYAIEHEKLQVLKWLYINRKEYREYLKIDLSNAHEFTAAAKVGNIDILNWLYDHVHSNLTTAHVVCRVAVEMGHIHVLYWLLHKFGKDGLVPSYDSEPVREWFKSNNIVI